MSELMVGVVGEQVEVGEQDRKLLYGICEHFILIFWAAIRRFLVWQIDQFLTGVTHILVATTKGARKRIDFTIRHSHSVIL